MTEYLNYLILGLGPGALVAAVALSLVLTNRAPRFLNLAVGTQAFYAATTYALLRRGRLLQPIPWLPGRISIGGGLSFIPAVLATLLVQAVLAAVLYAAVFRPLRGHGPMVQTIASLGVAVAVDALVDLQVGSQQVVVQPIFSASVLTLGGIRIPVDRLGPALIVAGLGVVVAGLYRWRQEAGLLARDPAPGTPFANWVLASLVAGLAGILVAPLLPLVSGPYTLLVVPALAAAAAGRFANVGVAVAGGLVIGSLESVTIDIALRHRGFPASASGAVPLLIVVIAVLGRGALLLGDTSSSVRPKLVTARPGSQRRSVLPGLVLGLVGLFVLTGTYRLALENAFIFSVIALSLVVITGLVGQVSLAQLTLAGVAGFSLSTLASSWHVPFPLAPVVASLVSAAGGVVIGILSLRGRGWSVAVISLAAATGVEALWFGDIHLDGGVGGASIPRPRLFGLDLAIGTGRSPRPAFGLLCLAVLVLVALGVGRLGRSRLGAAMLAVSRDEAAASSAGIRVARVKLLGFGVAGFVAGLGGCLIAYEQSHLTFVGFDALLGLIVFATTYLAGITSVSGGVIAGLISAGGPLFVFLNHVFTVGSWYGVIVGVGVVLVAAPGRDGVAGLAASTLRRLGLVAPVRRRVPAWLPNWVPRWLRRWRLWQWWRQWQRTRLGRLARRFFDI